MSSPPTAHENGRFEAGDPLAYLRKPVEVAGFWAAVVLPFLYVPLFVTGLQSTDAATVFAGLVVLHVLALVAGRNYRA